MKENSSVSANEIWYTTVDGRPIELDNKSVKRHTYNEGKGVIVFKKPLVEIGYNTFGGSEVLKGLQEIIIPEGVALIDGMTFSGCTSLQKVVIPESVTKIGSCAFMDCTALREIVIPAGVADIGSGAFRGCSNLTKISVAKGNPKYDSRDG